MNSAVKNLGEELLQVRPRTLVGAFVVGGAFGIVMAGHQQGLKAVNTLAAIRHNKYSAQPNKLVAWLSASHLERDPQRNNPQPTPTPTTVPAK